MPFRRSARSGAARRLAALASLAVALLIFDWTWGQGRDSSQRVVAILAAVTLSVLWWWHLELASLPRGWSAALALLISGQLLLSILSVGATSIRFSFGALGCGVFVYAMLWIFGTHDRQPGLWPVASAALLLSIGFIAKPAILLACVVASILMFVGERNRFGGMRDFALLLFTPLILFLLSVSLVAVLWAGTPQRAIQSLLAVYQGPPGWSVASRFALLIGESGNLCLIVAVLATRLLEGKTGCPDLACLFLLLSVGSVCVAPGMPAPPTPMDLSVTACAGAGSLVALEPPGSFLGRTVVFAGACAAVGIRLIG